MMEWWLVVACVVGINIKAATGTQPCRDHIDVIHPDVSNIIRPCEYSDQSCIRNEFAIHGWIPKDIRLPEDPYNDPLLLTEILIPETNFNLTIVLQNATFTGLQHGEVVEFYINKETNNALVGIKFQDFFVNSTGYFEYYRDCKEPVYIHTPISAYYPSMLVTTVITGLNALDSHEFRSHGRVYDTPSYELGCGIEDLEDDELGGLFADFADSISVAIQSSSHILCSHFANFYIALLTL